MHAYITHTGSYLPGPKVDNERIQEYLGTLDGESDVKRQVLAMNGITGRHYAQDTEQRPTSDVYQLAVQAIQNCLCKTNESLEVSYLSAGTTYAPLSGPGWASIIHHRLRELPAFARPIELSSHAGICTSAAAAIVSATRAVKSGEHRVAMCVGCEHASEILKSSVIRPIDDRAAGSDLRRTHWFMSVFLRFMLSDGAGALVIQDRPATGQLNWRIDWTHSMSFAHITPLCMKLENRNGLLTQDVAILSKHLFPTGLEFARTALARNNERLSSYDFVLPHLSSFFFRRKVERILAELSDDAESPVTYWTNLATAGNTGSASIYILLDQFLREHAMQAGQRLLLFIPESGQFNFVMVSLTAVE